MIQCSINSLLIVWFEPFYTPFWLLTFVPGLILFSYSVEAVMSRISLMPLRLSIIQRFIPIFFVLVGLVVFSHNLKYAMINNNKIDASSQAALNVWIENSDENDMLITAGDLISQLWFYSDRPNTIHLYHMLEKNIASADRFEYFKTQIDRTLCSGGKVIVAPDIASNCGEQFLNWLNISREDIGTFFASYPKEKYFTYKNLINGKDTQVYTITKPDSCDE
jgi:hypothetical protein